MQHWVTKLHRLALASRAVPVLVRYATTTALVFGVGFLKVTYGLGHDRYPFLVFFPVIFLCAALFNRGNGFLATALSALVCDYFLLAPVRSMEISTSEDRLALLVFVLIGLAISMVFEALHVGFVELATEHERARAAARDRELLMHELTHRTRNDFASVAMLLDLQARSSGEEARRALKSAADRVQAIARVHRQLELRDDRVVVNTQSYIDELCGDLRTTLLALRPIAIQWQAESHALGLEKVVPLGLIVNECITNAVKHAFPDNRQGVIEVNFHRVGNEFHLTIADDGVGMERPTRDGGMGNHLMHMLAAQLGARIEVTPRKPGTVVNVTIPVRAGGVLPEQTPKAI